MVFDSGGDGSSDSGDDGISNTDAILCLQCSVDQELDHASPMPGLRIKSKPSKTLPHPVTKFPSVTSTKCKTQVKLMLPLALKINLNQQGDVNTVTNQAASRAL